MGMALEDCWEGLRMCVAAVSVHYECDVGGDWAETDEIDGEGLEGGCECC